MGTVPFMAVVENRVLEMIESNRGHRVLDPDFASGGAIHPGKSPKVTVKGAVLLDKKDNVLNRCGRPISHQRMLGRPTRHREPAQQHASARHQRKQRQDEKWRCEMSN